MTLNEIETLAQRYAQAAHAAADLVTAAEAEMHTIKTRYVSQLRLHAANVADARAALIQAIESNPALWESPRTRVLHGVKVGMQKQPGALTWSSEARVIEKIKEHYVDEIGVLIKTTEKPVKDALARLPAADLKRLGITVVDSGDAVVVKLVAGDVEKLLKTLAGDLEREATAEGAGA